MRVILNKLIILDLEFLLLVPATYVYHIKKMSTVQTDTRN